MLHWAPEFSLSAKGVPDDFRGFLSWRALKLGIVRALKGTVLFARIGVDFVSDDSIGFAGIDALALTDGPDLSVLALILQ